VFDPTGTPSYVVRGRVIDERGGPLPEIGVTVRLWHDQGTYEDRVPGPAGEFRFEFGALGRHSKLWVNLPSSWRRRTDLLMLQSSLTPEQLSGEDEVRLLIAERLRGPVLGVAVDSKTGAPLADLHRLSERQARVEIESLDEFASDPSLLWRIERRAGLRPGDHLVRASTNQHGVRERVVSLQGGRLSKVELMLQLERGLRTIHGELRTESGAVPPSALLTVRLRDDPDRTWLGNFEAQRSAGDVSIGRRFGLRPGETTASFNFMNVPVGALEAKVEGPRDPVSIRFTDRADGGVDILVVVLDGTEGIGFGFCVLGPDGEPLGQRRVGRGLNMSLQTRKNGERSTWSSRVFDGRILERVDPRPEDFEWAVSTWRHRPVYGTSKDFVEEEPGRFFAPLRIERGWGTRVLVRTEDGQAVADCAIHVDGRRVGRTNASGWFDVELDESPERIGIELDDWLIVRHPDDSGGKPGESAWHEFVVRRANTPTRRVSAP